MKKYDDEFPEGTASMLLDYMNGNTCPVYKELTYTMKFGETEVKVPHSLN